MLSRSQTVAGSFRLGVSPKMGMSNLQNEIALSFVTYSRYLNKTFHIPQIVDKKKTVNHLELLFLSSQAFIIPF